MYLIPQMIKKERAFTKAFTMKDFFIVLSAAILSFLLASFLNVVVSFLHIPFYIFSLFFALWCTRRNKNNNPLSRNCKALILFLRRDRHTYYSMKTEDFPHE